MPTEGKYCLSCNYDYAITVPECPVCGRTLVFKAGTNVADRFTIEELIALGGMSQVYRAKQYPFGRQVALKVVPPSVAETASKYAIRNEAFLAGKVHHPHVVSVYDYGEFAEGHLYLAMEYLEGRTLAQAIQEEGRISPLRTIRILVQICEALSVLHDLGLVYRDLKPSNIFLLSMKDGEFVKLLDFGLVTMTRGFWSLLYGGRGRIGTPLYMSPEQIRGEALDSRSDLYALGAIAYEMLIGRPVFPGLDPLEEHLRHTPIPLTVAAPGIRIPKALDDLILRLLAKDPKQRPRSAMEVLERLKLFAPGISGAFAKGESEAEAVGPAKYRYFTELRLQPPTFVGRRKELRQFEECLRQAKAGKGGVLWWIGERGAGKTTLLERCLSMAKNEAFLVSKASGSSPMLGPFRDAALGLLSLSEPTQEEIRQSVAAALGCPPNDFLPEAMVDLIRPGPEIREQLAKDKGAYVAFLQAALEEFLRTLAQKRPVAIFLDDFHLADDDSATFIEKFCCSLRSKPAPILLVIASLPIPSSQRGEFRTLHRALGTVRFDGIVAPLTKLSEPEMAALLDSMAGTPCSLEVRQAIRRVASGNPLFAVQTFHHLQATGRVGLAHGKVRLLPDSDLSVPHQLLDLMEERLQELEGREDHGIACTEVFYRIVTLGLWASANRLNALLEQEGRHDLRNSIETLIDILAREGFITRVRWRGDEFYGPAHPLLADVLNAKPLDSAKRRTSIIAAQMLENSEDIDRSGAFHIGELYERAGYFDKAVDHFIVAGDLAFESAHFVKARQIFLRAERLLLDLGAKKDWRLAYIYVMLAELRFIEGEYEEAEKRLQAIWSRGLASSDERLRLRALEVGARLAEAHRRSDEALVRAEEVCRIARRMGERHGLASALLLMAAVHLDRGNNEKAMALIEEAEAQVKQDGNTRTMGLIYLMRGRVLRKFGSSKECFEALGKALEILSAPGDFIERAEALFFMGVKLVELGRRQEAENVFREGVTLCERTGFARGLAAHLTNLATTIARKGKTEEARDLVRRALDIREGMEDVRGVSHCLIALSDLALLEGDYGSAKELALRALSLDKKVKYPLGQRIALANLGEAALGLGDEDEAVKYFEESLETLKDDSFVDPTIPEVHERMARILERKGLCQEADKHRLAAIKYFEQLERFEDAERLRASLGAAI